MNKSKSRLLGIVVAEFDSHMVHCCKDLSNNTHDFLSQMASSVYQVEKELGPSPSDQAESRLTKPHM